MERFGAITRTWFEATFAGPTPVQARGWERIAAGEHALLIAPTGSGKTLAAFLWSIDRLIASPAEDAGVRILYVSPLKALAADIERNLGAPLTGIAAAAHRAGTSLSLPRVALRTGDTTTRERRLQAREPAEILVTTPESLYLMLTSAVRETLRTVETIIIDEVHALAPTKRGAHLGLSLERLCWMTGRDPQRIGLSATARPTEEVARYLGGDRPVSVVDTSARPAVDLEIVVPVEDMTRPEAGLEDERGGERGLWPAIHPRLIELIRAHRSTLIFVNSRGLCERLTHRLNELAGQELVRSHHGSLSHHERRAIEEQLVAGHLRAIVATSSLELGIDMGTLELVVLVESPGSVARGLQRVGRAGHRVGEVSIGRLFPKHRGDLLEAAVVARRMLDGEIEALALPRNPLDVLAQQIVATVAMEPWSVDSIGAVVRRAANFRDLPERALHGVLDMLAGRYPSNAFGELRPRLVWDRASDQLTARRGAKMVAIVNGGTIPDRGTYPVYLGEDGPRVGELDEEMVNETTPGQTFTLGATTWRVERVTRDRVLVSPAPGEAGKLPFWRGDGPGRPIELGRGVGALVRALDAMPSADAIAYLEREHRLDRRAAVNLVAYITEQHAATGTVPTDRSITVERFRDELGDWRVCIITPFGARVHAPWALAIEQALGRASGYQVQALWSDDGIVLRCADSDVPPPIEALLPDPDDLDELVVDQLAHSTLFAGLFRENAARALLMPRRRPGQRTPLWVQRIKSQELLAVARQYPSFPIIIETYRGCLQDAFDMPALIEVLRAVRAREIAVEPVETRSASPFARSLIVAYVAANLYEGDAPLAERRAQALSLDRNMLRELLGQEELRELLDPEVIAEVEAELQRLGGERRARDADDVHDLVRRVGDLTLEELDQRCEVPAAPLIGALIDSGRALAIELAGQRRFIAAEDAALVRDALGVALPAGLPPALLEPHPNPTDELLTRFARTRAPFVAADLAARYGLPPAHVEALLAALEQRGLLVSGDFHPGGTGTEWCDPDVLRRIKRRTLARLRNEVSPVEAAALGLFLPAWHGIGKGRGGRARLQEVLIQLEGLALPYAELESVILPARVADFAPAMLDELGAIGWLVWVGSGGDATRKSGGKLALYRRDQVASLLEPPELPATLSGLHQRLLDHLRTRGASFFVALMDAGAPATRLEVEQALWDLVWHGLITNDTLQPLRILVRKRPAANRPGRSRRAPRVEMTAPGRWSLVADLLARAPTATERLHARATKLLERHGIVGRETNALETMPGGFAAVYPVLRAMEEAGRIRRGYFVEELGGAQFALPGAVDRLRSAGREAHRDPLVLSAVDPACPFGWLVPWPGSGAPEGTGGPRRLSGARVILVGGAPVLYLDPSASRLYTFPAAADRGTLLAAAGALTEIARARRGKWLRIDSIDGEPARTSRYAEALRAVDFFADPKGLVLEASSVQRSPAG
ncbi:MAG TPA: DEAD/DEAH box helicase [Kofleriaceae bacterium]|nr:DEAD/DEAH box helicase [Kofleriaceae bacterium]